MLFAGLCLLCLGLIAVQPAAAKGKRNIGTGFVTWGLDDLQRMQQSGAAFVRINVRWDSIAPHKPLIDPGLASNPAYHFTRLDEEIVAANAGGLTPILTIYGAPSWAEGPNRPPGAEPGAWMPNPQAYGTFTHALASRYSGSFPIGGGRTLPLVRNYEIWNEPNLAVYVAPQWKDGKPYSPTLYAKLLNAAYGAIKKVSASNKVIAGATAPHGFQHSVGDKMAPITFLQSLFCVNGARPCAPKPHLDALSHHPIYRGESPTTHESKMNVAAADLGRIKGVLRAAKAHHTYLPQHKVPLWITEFWWESNPPDRKNGVPVMKQARWIEQALYLFWRAGSPVALNLQVRDSFLPHPDSKPLSYQAGIFYADGRKKPSYTAFTFPFVGDRSSKRRVLVWGKAPKSGKLKIQVRKKHHRRRHRALAGSSRRGHKPRAWRTVKRVRVHKGTVFTARIRLRGHAKIRGTVAKQHSIVWPQR